MSLFYQIHLLKQTNRALCAKRNSIVYFLQALSRQLENGCKDHREVDKKYWEYSKKVPGLNAQIEENGQLIIKLREQLKNDKIQNKEGNITTRLG